GVGHDPDSTVGHVVGEGLDAHTAADIRAFYRAAMIEPVHRTVARDDGRWLEVDAQPVTGPDGTTLVLSLSRDVTARRAAELSAQAAAEALTRSEARFRTAFDSAPIGMLLVSASKATFGRCVGVNAAFARMVGRPARDLVGSPLTQLVDPSAPALLLSPNLATGDDRRATTSLQHASGATTPVELVYSLSTDASGAPLFVVQVEDITARRATEVALLDALEQQHAAEHALREADRVRTDVVSTVSHELRTPLTALGASLHLLAEGDAGPVSAQQLELLAIAQRNATRLERLIDNLLLLTTLDRTIDADGDETVDLVETVRRAADLVVPAMTRREQHLELDLPSAAVVVAGDDMQLCFAMVKLLANAAQFSDTGGRVVVRLTQDADGVAVTVSDDGVGIPDDEREQIFDRFFRGAHAQSLGLPGTGLGLSIAQSVARRHGGRITVESTAGVGSTFRMRLPRRPAVPTGRPGTDRAVTPAVGVPHVA
ncbi:MAG: PAS domain-containing sensor histidine kinase, partial [Jatrophihabitans sp.]|uniref:PAS domain-containing sensor histidine kinase n=1 Tax=Jatrophihabitans sp. TaxID=1932789 RepID=UPI003F7D10C3